MEAEGSSHDSTVDVELRGLSIYTHHGVSDAEQEIGQRLEIDISFDVPDCDAVLTDRVEDTIDYGEVADIVALAATERSYRTLERLGPRDRRAADGALRIGRRSGSGLPSRSRRCRWRSTRLRSRWCARGSPTRTTSTTASTATSASRSMGETGYLGLGSNVGDRSAHLRAAIELLRREGVGGRRRSPRLYETEPVGEILDQPDFLNAAIRIRTELEPEGLLDALQGDRGRARPCARWAATRPAAARHRPAAARGDRARERAADPSAPAGAGAPLRPRSAARARPGADAARRDPARRRARRARGRAGGAGRPPVRGARLGP